MTRHHTKDKGDLGVAKAHADLVAQDFVVLFPATEHAAFDLVAYRHGRFHRIQVKHRAMRPTGAIYVEFKSNWVDRNGVHTSQLDKESVDVFCIYCPDTDQCYYVRPADHGRSVTLRILPSRNGQRSGVWSASDLRMMPVGGDIAETSTSLPERASGR